MSFSLPLFLPYLLNQAAEAASKDFQHHYRDTYGMLRTEWRVLFHLGTYGDMTASQICTMASLHKTKVSRAVTALQNKRFLTRETDPDDRRVERLSLTRQGRQTFDDLHQAAARYQDRIAQSLTPQEMETLRRVLLKLIPTAT